MPPSCDMFKHIPKLVTADNNKMLLKMPEMEELRSLVKDMPPSSSLGHDGFSAYFYNHSWEVIKWDLYEAICHFFKGGNIPRSVNSTLISLIPKSENPKTLQDFRPISLCNVFYNFFSKCLADSLGNILPKVISPNQHGFVRGRLMSECIGITQEMA